MCNRPPSRATAHLNFNHWRHANERAVLRCKRRLIQGRWCSGFSIYCVSENTEAYCSIDPELVRITAVSNISSMYISNAETVIAFVKRLGKHCHVKNGHMRPSACHQNPQTHSIRGIRRDSVIMSTCIEHIITQQTLGVGVQMEM